MKKKVYEGIVFLRFSIKLTMILLLLSCLRWSWYGVRFVVMVSCIGWLDDDDDGFRTEGSPNDVGFPFHKSEMLQCWKIVILCEYSGMDRLVDLHKF